MWIGALLLALPAAVAAAPQAESAELLAGRAGAYVEHFEKAFESVVMEEHYVQVGKRECCREPASPDLEPALAWDPRAAAKSPSAIVATRRLVSDVLLVRLPEGLTIGYRDVFEVDGQQVRDRQERLHQLLLTDSAESRSALAAITLESSRYNLGTLRRTINFPTMPFLYLHPERRRALKFKREPDEALDGVSCAVLEFREVVKPTLVATPDGDDMPAKGRLWVEPESGRIRQIEVRVGRMADAGRLMRVRFRADDRVPVLVPDWMWEWYAGNTLLDPVLGHSLTLKPPAVECLARYSNLRLFTVSTQESMPLSPVVPPQQP